MPGQRRLLVVLWGGVATVTAGPDPADPTFVAVREGEVIVVGGADHSRGAES